MPAEPRGEIITFYSYKGGTGRSMALANIACLLAQSPDGAPRRRRGEGVLVIDWDLEAPGLHRYFRATRRLARRKGDPATDATDDQPGLIDYFRALCEAADRQSEPPDQTGASDVAARILDAVDLDSYVLNTQVAGLYLLKAGKFDGDYAKRVNTFDWELLFRRFPTLYRQFANRLAQQYRYVLIDSRTGITDTSGICTMLLPEKLVVVFTPNRQSLTGCVDLVRRATEYRSQSDDLRPLVVFPLSSRVVATETALVAQWRFGSEKEGIEGYQPQFEQAIKAAYDFPDCDLTEYFDEAQIQQVSDYAFGEQIAVLVERGAGRLSLTRSFETFADYLKRGHPWIESTERPVLSGALSEEPGRESVETPKETGEAVELESDEPVLRDPPDGATVRLSPGDSMRLRFSCRNLLSRAATFVLEEDRSLPAEWVTLVWSYINLPPQGTGELVLRLSLPHDAPAGSYPFTVIYGPLNGTLSRRTLRLFVPAAPASQPAGPLTSDLPVIETVNPSHCTPGELVAITGRNLGSRAGKVILHGDPYPAQTWSPDAVEITMPDGYQGNVAVNVALENHTLVYGFTIVVSSAKR